MAPRLNAGLRHGGNRYGRKRIACLIDDAGLVERATAWAARWQPGGSPARHGRSAGAEPCQPGLFVRAGSTVVADITYVQTAAGFLYLAIVLDA